MKKLAILATLVTAFVFITGCASKCNTGCNEPAPCHQDVKGEVH